MGVDYVELKIDTDRDTNGAAVAKRLRKGEGGGIPWMVILDAKGEELVNADGPGGNVGCPVTPEERAWFLEMLRKSMQHMTEEQFQVVEKNLADHAEKILNR